MTAFKFRVWDSEQHRFIFFSFDDMPSMTAFWGTREAAAWDSFTCHQYTGLTDKQGNEIYSSDILREGFHRRYLVAWFDHGWTYFCVIAGLN